MAASAGAPVIGQADVVGPHRQAADVATRGILVALTADDDGLPSTGLGPGPVGHAVGCVGPGASLQAASAKMAMLWGLALARWSECPCRPSEHDVPSLLTAQPRHVVIHSQGQDQPVGEQDPLRTYQVGDQLSPLPGV